MCVDAVTVTTTDDQHHEDGASYRNMFRFSGDLICNVDAPPITAAKLGTLKFRNLEGPSQHIPAQNAVNLECNVVSSDLLPMYGINATGNHLRDCIFILHHTSLKLTLLLHKTAPSP